MTRVRSPFAYADRHLPALTRAQIEALPDKARTPVIVTTGAIEQHGPHLPVAVDALMGQVWLTRVFAALPADLRVVSGPPITVGKSNEHVGFPGTLFVSKETLRLQLFALARQLHAWGFRSLLVLNTHGGNSAVLAYVLRELERGPLALPGFRAALLRPSAGPSGLSAQEAAYGFHAGELESSWLYAVAPDFCRPENATRAYPALLTDPGKLRPECAPATFAWASQDVSPDGVMGDATAATAEKGERWIAELAAGYAQTIREHLDKL